MRTAPSPARQNMPKAAFSSPGLGLGTNAGEARPLPIKPAKPSAPPTHSAFTQASRAPATDAQERTSGYQSPGLKDRPVRQGALYGALEALQAAAAALGDSDELDSRNMSSLHSAPTKHGRGGGAASLTPEEVWQSIPAGGEAAWKSSQARKPLRLKVAKLQEALSEGAVGLQKAGDVCRGGGDDDLAPANLGAVSLGPPGPSAALRNECAVLEAESKELKEEKAFLDARMVEVRQELARVKEMSRLQAANSPNSPGVSQAANGNNFEAVPKSPAESNAPATAEDVSELAVVLRLLACLKDVALANRSVILPNDPTKWNREQQVVAYFLDEVEACQSRIDGV